MLRTQLEVASYHDANDFARVQVNYRLQPHQSRAAQAHGKFRLQRKSERIQERCPYAESTHEAYEPKGEPGTLGIPVARHEALSGSYRPERPENVLTEPVDRRLISNPLPFDLISHEVDRRVKLTHYRNLAYLPCEFQSESAVPG